MKNCQPYLIDELAILHPRVIICLGGIAWNATLSALATSGETIPTPRPKFAHNATASIGDTLLLGCYHVSQQNTFTGRLTTSMLDQVIAKAIELSDQT